MELVVAGGIGHYEVPATSTNSYTYTINDLDYIQRSFDNFMY